MSSFHGTAESGLVWRTCGLGGEVGVNISRPGDLSCLGTLYDWDGQACTALHYMSLTYQNCPARLDEGIEVLYNSKTLERQIGKLLCPVGIYCRKKPIMSLLVFECVGFIGLTADRSVLVTRGHEEMQYYCWVKIAHLNENYI